VAEKRVLGNSKRHLALKEERTALNEGMDPAVDEDEERGIAYGRGDHVFLFGRINEWARKVKDNSRD